MPATPRLKALALFGGVAVGFACAVVLGHQAADYSKPSAFKRFHQEISPDSAFYPPFRMMENLALARCQPGKILVIIGGNSVLNGVGQPIETLWSQRLGELLGNRYTVVNLSFRGAYASEGAALVAESIMKRGLPVIYVANTAPGPMARPYESMYAWVFWDALAEGRLLENAPRAAELTRRFVLLPHSVTDGMRSKELAARLNHFLRFNDLWHHVAYRYIATVWSAPSRGAFLEPKDTWLDAEPNAKPVGERFNVNIDGEMQIVRGYFSSLTEADDAGGWRATTPSLLQTGADIDEIFTPAFRSRMLIVFTRHAPFYRERLTPAEQARDAAMYAAYEKVWRDHGVAAVTLGTDFESSDYFDRTHLIGSGGEKLAHDVARAIQDLPPPVLSP